MAMSDESLNPAQLRAVDHDAGPLIVLAGPGTGKTRVLTRRVERIIKDGADPESIVAVTFTIKAAGELRERLAALVGASAADRVNARTLHAFGQRLILRFGDTIGLAANPQVIDSAQERRLLREIIATQRIAPLQAAGGWDALIGRTVEHISAFRDHAISPRDLEGVVEAWKDRCRPGHGEWDAAELAAQRARVEEFETVCRLYAAYEEGCARRGWVSLDQLITLPIRILRESPGAAAICRAEFRHLLVDEFQDVNRAQIELLRLLAPPESGGEGGPDICVVGDDDQSIYAFRGADDRAFFHFAQGWPRHERVELRVNYRSHAGIVEAANAVIARASARFAPEKRVEADARKPAPGAGVECIRLERELDDGDAIAAMILLDRHEGSAGEPRPLRDYAVIARTHGDLERIDAALRLEGIPTREARRRSPAEDPGVQDVLAWVELLVHPEATWAARRVLLRPPLGAGTALVAGLEREYLARSGRAEFGAEAPGPYADWLARRAPDDPVIERFAGLHGRLREIAATSTADEAILRIMLLADVAHADLLAPVEHAARVLNLVSVLRFVRDLVPRLDPPGDLAAFWVYRDDLREDEAGFGGFGDGRIDRGTADDEEDGRDAVTLLTAFGAKGLEFDTVFVPRVCPPHGYPTSRSGGLELPEGLLDRAGDTRTVKERRIEEERRVFYVACTRAKRRLVLLARGNKKPSKSEHFFEEFTCDEAGQRLVAVRDALDILNRAAKAGLRSAWGGEHELESAAADLRRRELRRDALERARREARVRAAEALHGADRPDLPAEVLEQAHGALASAASRLAVIAHVEKHGSTPGWAHGDLGAFGAALERATVRPPDAPGPVELFGTNLRPPLELSFTKINDYGRCPACFFVKHVLRLGDAPSGRMDVGSAVHDALHRFYERWRSADAGEGPRPGLEDLLAQGRASFLEGTAPNRAPDRAALGQVLALLTLSFERLHDPGANILELEHVVRFAYPLDGHEHTFSAKLDRVDQLADGGLRIIDYKTGSASKRLLEPDAGDLQLGIYALALRSIYAEAASSGTAEYWLLQTAQRGSVPLDRIDEAGVRATIDGAIRGMLAGEYPSKPGRDCSGVCEILGLD